MLGNSSFSSRSTNSSTWDPFSNVAWLISHDFYSVSDNLEEYD